MRCTTLAAQVLLLLTAAAVPAPQVSCLPESYISRTVEEEPTTDAEDRANVVKQTFQIAWDGYYKYAFPNDELLPVNYSFANTLCVPNAPFPKTSNARGKTVYTDKR